jgi:methylase of polypeptide subunit release factors
VPRLMFTAAVTAQACQSTKDGLQPHARHSLVTDPREDSLHSSEPSRPGAEMPPGSAGPLAANDSQSIELFRQALENSNFTESALREALGADMSPHLKRTDRPLYERRLSAGVPLNVLIKLFTLQLPVGEEAARRALHPLALESGVALGLVQKTGNEVRACASLSFCDGLWLAYDASSETTSHLAADYVLGLNPAAATLAKLAVRRHARLALDVGTGCGVQALLCARHSDHVIAVDTNPRALNYTLFNARLNRLNNVECRLGNLFEPVAGCRFDLIVCNPPFVISPESEYLFRDSGLPGDKLSEEVVRKVPAYLAEGGFASVLCSWTNDQKEDWSTHVKGWVENNGCDTWLLHGLTQDPLSYAAGWNRGLEPAAYGECLDRWQAYYKRLGIQALSLGAVVMRRRAGDSNWLRTDKLPENSVDSFSDHILRIVRAEDFLRAHASDESLLAQTYRMAEDQQVRQTFVCRNGKLVLERMEVELIRGLRFRGVLGPSALQLFGLCDGQCTLEQILGKLQSAPVSQTPANDIRRQAAVLARELVSCGFLLPVDSSPPSDSSPSADRSVPHPPLTRTLA